MINRINNNDTIKGFAYDRDGKIVATTYDSGFSSINEVINRLISKSRGCSLRRICSVQIINCDKSTNGYYSLNGRKI